MPPTKLTDRDIEFIKSNRFKMTATDIAKELGLGKSVIARYIRVNGLSIPKELQNKLRAKKCTGKTTSTPEMDQFIIENYLSMPVKTIGTKLNKSGCFVTKRLIQLGLVIPKEIAEQRKLDARYKKGREPENKGQKMPAHVYEKVKHTMFKKGQTPLNALSIGAETVRFDKRTGRRYVMIKVEGFKKLLYKHIYIWELKNGKVPKGYNVVFKDGNQMNCVIENLECISNAELMQRNTIHQYPEELKSSIRLLTKLKKKINEKQSGRLKECTI